MRRPCSLLALLVLLSWQGLLLAEEPARLDLVVQTGHTSDMTSVALSGDGKLALTGSLDTTAILWDAANGKKLGTFPGHTHAVMSVALSSDGKRALTGSIDKT